MAVNELKISRERVLKAASKCPDAKNVLKTLFPEVFEEPDKKTVPLIESNTYLFPVGHPMRNIIFIRNSGGVYPEQDEKGLFLATKKGYTFSLREESPGMFLEVIAEK